MVRDINGVRVNELTYYMTRAIDARDLSYLLMSNNESAHSSIRARRRSSMSIHQPLYLHVDEHYKNLVWSVGLQLEMT